MEEIRLQKFLADHGVASRRKSEELILQGQIKVNDKIITTLGVKINPSKDIVKYKDKIIKARKREKSIYIIKQANRICDYCKRPIFKRYSIRFSKR